MDAMRSAPVARPARVAWSASRRNPTVTRQQAEEAAHLRLVRSRLVRAPHVRLGHLDERIAAHLDGVAVAGPSGVRQVHQVLERPGVGQVFVATLRAIEDRDPSRLAALLSIAAAVPSARAGLLSAFGWTHSSNLKGVGAPLLGAADPWHRCVALKACAMHGVEAGRALADAIEDPDADLRARALDVAGRFGRVDLREACVAALTDDVPRCAFEAARSALFLGDRVEAVRALETAALRPDDGAPAEAALCLVLKVLSPERAGALLAAIAKDPERVRALVRGIAIAGDPHYVPSLLARTDDPLLGCLVGEAFSFIVGMDLALLDLKTVPPVPVPTEPGLDEDADLPWPDAAKLRDWWAANRARFAVATRHVVGGAPSPATFLEVLRSECQRQRIAAAEFLCLASPEAPLFNLAAPAARQQWQLA